MPYKYLEKRREHDAEYSGSPAGKAVRAKYDRTPEGKANKARAKTKYNKSPKGKATVAKCVARYQKNHPEMVLAKNAARRARKTGVFIEKVYRSVVLREHRGLCGECGGAVDPNNVELDHIYPINPVEGCKQGEHSYANTQLTHPTCNRAKSNKCPGCWNCGLYR